MTARVCLVLLFSTLGWTAERCDPPAKIAESLSTLPDDNGERRKVVEEALQSSPGDFWLNRLFLGATGLISPNSLCA